MADGQYLGLKRSGETGGAEGGGVDSRAVQTAQTQLPPGKKKVRLVVDVLAPAEASEDVMVHGARRELTRYFEGARVEVAAVKS